MGSSTILVLFGLSGAGKTYIAKLFASHFGFYHLEGDDLLPISIQKKFKNNEPVSKAEITDFVEKIILSLRELTSKHSKIVLSQALYMQSNRDQLRKGLSEHRVSFIEIIADKTVIESRIELRFKSGESFVSPACAEAQAIWFEPMASALKIYNHGYHETENLLNQIQLILNKR